MPTKLKDEVLKCDADVTGYHTTSRKPKGTVHFLYGRDDDGWNIATGVVWCLDVGEIEEQ
jgi:hypothetical protein